MICDELDDLIEAMAEDDEVAAAYQPHLATCAQCAARLALARTLDRTLRTREVPVPPPGFTAQVMLRVGQEQWRAEQIVDAGFNLAVILGVALIAFGAVALAFSFGWLTVDRPTIEVLGAALQPWLTRVSNDLRTVAMAALLLTSALALWWWVERESSF